MIVFYDFKIVQMIPNSEKRHKWSDEHGERNCPLRNGAIVGCGKAKLHIRKR